MKETLAQELAGHVSRMYRVALRIVGSTDAAQEIVAGCLPQGPAGGRKVRRPRRPGHLAPSHHRELRLRSPAKEPPARIAAGPIGTSDTVGMLAVLEAGPAEHAEQNETYRLALTLVAKLPEDCRSAFMLTQLDGYTYDEAAAIENLSRGTVASRVYRARQILMEQMNHHLAGEMP